MNGHRGEKAKMLKKKKDKEPPYSLLRVSVSKENKYAGTVMIWCSSGHIFTTLSNGSQNAGALMLAEWGNNDKLRSLYEVNQIQGEEILLGRSIKDIFSCGNLKQAKLSEVEDLR